ncbi:MAG: ABC transporter ATP-binding protein [Oscillospiraceae bacterium]|nr:ABC transporter ATP-binding protein [Oscillospiraceae bacterium]
MANLICKGVLKRYKDKEALAGVDLTIESGKIYGLIGRNGAGKTTLLSVIAAQNPLTAGEVTLDGEVVWENRSALDRICFSRELNVSAGSGIAGYKIRDYFKAASVYYPNWDQQMADRLIKAFKIDLKKSFAKVNKGMVSSVTITVALASKAEFTFLDEPVAGLDVIAREFFYRTLLQEYAESGRTFVISTHIIEEAAGVFEEVIFLKDGKVMQKENTETLLARSIRVSGLAAEVDAATAGLRCHYPELLGRSKTVTVVLGEGEAIPEGYDVTLQPVHLQQLFVALCGEEGMG